MEAQPERGAEESRPRRFLGAFLDGVRMLGVLHVSPPELLDDTEAMRRDWAAVGDDLHQAMSDFAIPLTEQEQPK